MNINMKSKKSSSCWQRRRLLNDKSIDDDDEELKELNEKLDKGEKKRQENLLTISSEQSTFGHNNQYSCVSMKSTASDLNDFIQLTNKFTHNVIRIQDSNGLFLNNQGSKYLNFKFEMDADKGILRVSEQLRYIPKFMSTVWRLKSPKIIIPIITGVNNFKNWKNRKLEDQFKRGIIKAANKTEMWFITNGINGGISQMVGDALSEELATRSTPSNKKDDLLAPSEIERKPIVLIGISDSSSLNNASAFDGNDSGYIRAAGNKLTGKTFRFDLNPDHTHFIIYNDKNNSDQMSYNTFCNRLEALFTKSLSHYKRLQTTTSEVSDDEGDLTKPVVENRQTPMVCLTIRGDLNSIDEIEFKVRKEIPVVILKGSGAACDIIAFAVEEMSENKDPDYEESYIRPELAKKLLEEFNEDLNKNDVLRNKYRDKILSIVKNGTKGTQKFVTIVDMKGLTFDFQDLDKYILTALLQSQTQLSGKSGKAQLERNLSLTLDWNREDLALSEIFQRDDYTQIEIKHGIFENAILRRDREQFVELFLDQGFYIHRYLGRNNIRDLFERSENRDFFVNVILQGMLGHFTSELPENFLPDGLNHVLKKLTSIDHMVNILEIYMNQLGFYVTDAKHAEKKALNFLVIFAVLMNRHKLAKMLWKRTEDPIPVALICSLMYKNLLPYCQENYIRAQIEKYQADFADCAVGVLDASFQENDPRSYACLQEKYADWNNSTALELAYNSKNRNFIAHPCCQKMLTKRLFGYIQVRETTKGIIELPIWVKVITSAFLILPMYKWIIFPVVPKKTSINNENENEEDEEVEKDEEKEEEEQTKAELNRKLLKEIKKTRRTTQKNTFGRFVNGGGSDSDPLMNKKSINLLSSEVPPPKVTFNEESRSKEPRKFVSPPIHRKIHMIWSAPYTKFWINFISYIFFLILFGIVTLWPACGNLLLDSTLWFWTATIAVEDTRVAYYKYFTGSQLPLRGQILEILFMILFLVVFLVVRILGIWNSHGDFANIDRVFLSKAVLCVFLLYFYYRTVFIFLPISHKLGPMLVRMKLMIKHDFATYLRLFLIFMTAGAIALNAILYPYYPVGVELLKRVVLFRGFMQLFASDKVDLERVTDDCKISNLSHKPSKAFSCVNITDGLGFTYSDESLKNYGISPKCNYMSSMAWVILIQYFLLVKLFLPSLLTAMFSATGQRISAQSEQLWMFQRYEIVLDYENRLTFPPPFTFLSYIIMFFEWLWHQYTCCWRKCKVFCDKCCNKSEKFLHDLQQQQQEKQAAALKPSSNVLHYWRNLAQAYDRDSAKDEKEKQKQKFLETSLNKVREDLGSQKKSLQRLNDRVISLEKSFIQSQSYLETIKNLLTQKTSKSTLFDRKKSNYIHILSRESPYIFTNVARFFVYEKLVPWECAYDVYDPPFVSLSFELLKIDRIFVDDEPNQKLFDDSTPKESKSQFEMGLTGVTTSTGDNATQAAAENEMPRKAGSQMSLSQKYTTTFLWNAIMTIDLPDGRVLTVDRKSWIIKIDEQSSVSYPLIYSLDSLGLPRNPMGRTGVRGRGALYRYGPNHEIMAIVTRWKKYKNKIIYVDRRKLLEFIACKDSLTSQMKIPGDKVLGDESKFSVVCRTFMELVFEETSVERVTNFTEQDMTSFFASFASNKPMSFDTSAKSNQQIIDAFNELGFFANMIYSGYIDDPRNTDNAWIEAEIWNFHYDKDEFFDKRIKNPTSKWKEVSSNVRIHSNDIIVDVLKEVAETHSAFYN